MTDLLTNLLANRNSREMLVDWLELSAELIKALDKPDPDGKTPLALFKDAGPKPEPEEDEESEDEEEQEKETA